MTCFALFATNAMQSWMIMQISEDLHIHRRVRVEDDSEMLCKVMQDNIFRKEDAGAVLM